MKALVASCLCALALVACGHKKPRDAKNAPATAAATPREANKCEVKGFAYSVPAPGPITDGGAP